MAALSFFRRRQKLVIGMMVLLMVAFLIPTGVRGCFQQNQGTQEIGQIGGDKITLGDRNLAAKDLQVLQAMGLGGQHQARTNEEGIFGAFLVYNRETSQATNWALLVYEAKKLGLKVSSTQIGLFLSAMGLEGPDLQRELSLLSRNGISEAQMRQAVGELILVTQAFILSSREEGTGPSLPELRHDYRDIREKLDLGVVTFAAADYLKGISEPSDQQVQSFFEQHKELLANSSDNRTRYGFGYRVPDQLNIQYLLVNSDAIMQAMEPSEELMLGFWEQSGRRMITKVPASQSATAPSTQPASQSAASEPAEEVTIVLDKFSEARPAIREQLRMQETERKTNELLSRARELVGQFKAESDPYAKTVQTMLRPADALLGKPVGSLRGSSLTLSELIEQLDQGTGVRIAYPFGQRGNFFLDGSVKVKVEAKWTGQPLGDVLNEIADAHKYPRLKWTTCEGLETAIFPVDPIDAAPIQGGGTGLIGVEQAVKNPLLIQASLGGVQQDVSKTILGIATSVFRELPGTNVLIHKGEDFRDAMIIQSPFRGKVIWRLADYELAHTPKELTPEIRQKLVYDLKLVQALDKAEKAAADLQAKAQSGANLEQLAKAQSLPYSKTGWITRKVLYGGQMEWSNIPGVGQNPEFIQTAFQLAPSDPDHPDAAASLEIVPLYRAEKVLLLQRIGYEPVTMRDFEREGITQMGLWEKQIRHQSEGAYWLSGNAIPARVGYIPRGDNKVRPAGPNQQDEED